MAYSSYDFFLSLVKDRRDDELFSFVETLSDQDRIDYASTALNTTDCDGHELLIGLGAQPSREFLSTLSKRKERIEN